KRLAARVGELDVLVGAQRGAQVHPDHQRGGVNAQRDGGGGGVEVQVGGGGHEGVVAGAARVTAARHEQVEGGVAGAADGDVVGPRGQPPGDGRPRARGGLGRLGQQPVAERVVEVAEGAVTVVQADGGGDGAALRRRGGVQHDG